MSTTCSICEERYQIPMEPHLIRDQSCSDNTHVLPLYQNKIPKEHHKKINAVLVMIGGMNPASSVHGVMNLLKPYAQRFLLIVIATTIEPVTGL